MLSLYRKVINSRLVYDNPAPNTAVRRTSRPMIKNLYAECVPFETLDTGLFAGMTASYSTIAIGFSAGDDPAYGAMNIPFVLQH